MIGCISKRHKLSNKIQYSSSTTLTEETEHLLNTAKTRQNNLKQLSSYLSELESQLSLMFAASPDIIVFLDGEANILKISDAAFTILGYRRTELIGKSLWEFVAASDIDKTKEYFDNACNQSICEPTAPQQNLVNHWISKKGELVKLIWRFAFYDENEKQTIGIASNITEFGSNEKQDLKVLQRAVDLSMDGILVTDSHNKTNNIVYVNDAFCKMTGYSREEFVGHNGKFLQSEECRTARVISTLRNSIKNGKGCDVLLQNVKRNGEIFYNRITVSAVREGTEVINYIWICKDVTDDMGIKYEWSPNTERGFLLVREQYEKSN
jgi:PAS domain S-box-containing protein